MKMFYTTKDIAELLDIEQHTVRNWSNRYSVLKPIRGNRGVMKFKEKDLHYFKLIHNLIYVMGYSYSGVDLKIKEYIKSGSSNKIDILANLNSALASLEEIKKSLEGYES